MRREKKSLQTDLQACASSTILFAPSTSRLLQEMQADVYSFHKIIHAVYYSRALYELSYGGLYFFGANNRIHPKIKILFNSCVQVEYVNVFLSIRKEAKPNN